MSSETILPQNETALETDASNSVSSDGISSVERWKEARAAYPIYEALARQFGHAELSYPDGEVPPAKPTREIFERDLQWLDKIDANIKAFQIRQLPPTTINAHEEALRAFLHRQLRKPDKSECDRDKIDFLTVQYFALCAPETMYHEEITLEDVARVLEPVVVNPDSAPLDWCAPLETILDSVKQFRSLRDLLENGVLEQGRLLKESSGTLFYDPAALITFARFNFLVRRAFIRLLHADQDAVIKAIDELERAGVRSVDCRRAGYSAAESVGSLRLFAQNWRPLYQKDYAENAVSRSFEQLLALRTDLEDAIAKLRTEFAESAPSAVAEAQPAEAASETVTATESQTVPHEGASEAHPAEETELAPATLEPFAEVKSRPALQERASEAQAVRETQAAETSPEQQQNEATAQTITPTIHRNDISTKPLELMDPSEPPPKSSATSARPAGGSVPSAGVPLSPEAESCLEAVWEQLIAAPPSRGRSMSTIVLKNTKVLLSSWEVAAFVSEGGQESEDLRRAVVARAMIALAMDLRKQTGESVSLDKALESARAEVSHFQGRVEEAKQSKNVEAAVNLGISTKRLLSFIEEAEKLQP